MDSFSIPAPPGVIAALRAALQAAPGDLPLRLQLGAVLLTAGDHDAALEQFMEILARDPAYLSALRGVSDAAEGLGQTFRARAYRRLHQSLVARAGAPPRCSPAEGDRRMPAVFAPAQAPGEPARVPVMHEDEPDEMEIYTESPEISLT